ncbi:MAG: N-acetylmuramoyl-L-alanine amidase [Leptospirales bacterium]|nr:N-acetylmuramoyl-L-alanine amidase [Leptospirales bacterium]
MRIALLKKIRYILPFLLLCFIAGNGMGADSLPVLSVNGKRYISLYDMQASFPFEASFDIILQRGKLYRKEHVVVYKVGHSYVLADNMLVRGEYPVIREKGDILLPLYLAEKIIEAFYPELLITYKGGALTFRARELPDKSGAESAPPPSADPIAFIIVDAGHGGRDPGAVGKGGLKEKNITLNVAKDLEASLKRKIKNIPVYLTRRADIFLELHERTEFANKRLKKNTNGIFVSVHVNASISPKISGFETYFLSQNPSNEEARNTAALENNVVIFEEKAGRKKKYGEIEYIEARMITTQIQKESALLAKSIQDAMSKNVKPFKSRGVRKADFYVLRGALMPAVLVEVGFITNESESQSLNKQAYQKMLSESISSGIAAFIAEYNKMIK